MPTSFFEKLVIGLNRYLLFWSFFLFPWRGDKNLIWRKGQRKNEENGQIIVEYVLLLVVAVSIAVLITSLLVSRSADEPGYLIVKWKQIIDAIGSDVVD